MALLKADHRTVEDLFAQFEKASGDGRKEKIAHQICLKLSVHAKIEAGLDMDRLGEELAARKADLVAEYKASGIPKPELTTMETAAV